MKKILITIFLTLSTFFIISAFATKSTGKSPITFSYVMQELENANIGFDIKNDIEELKDSMNDLNNIEGSSSSVLSNIKNIAKTIYFVARFGIKLIIHSLVAVINIIILVVRVTGLVPNMNYIRLTTGNKVGASGQVPTVKPGWIGWS